jgi:tRNA U34 5-methylaminomethyl-2-thiouridine-forming methyltransferase MnmC
MAEENAPLPPPAIDWTGAVPVARDYGDPYYSLADGLAEARHVFLAGNRLPGRLVPGFRVAELGFGTGLNALALAAMAEDAGVAVAMTSFEAHPMAPADMARALAPFDGLAHRGALVDAWARGERTIRLGALTVEIVEGDARETLPAWSGRADAWFLDGFAPARNPELWGPELLAAVAGRTAPGGTFATYTAAGHVRRALAEAGFAVERRPGYGAKRHMTVGRLP